MIDDASYTAPAPRRPWRILGWVVVLLVLAGAGFGGWYGWQAWQSREHQREALLARQRSDLQGQIERLRGDQRAFARGLQDQAATNRVLRDEVLGLGQRNAALEDTVAKLADTSRGGAQALRLDEVELLLTLGQQRLAIAGDVDGTRRAYALAATTLAGIDDPHYLDLRQTLAQERAALARPDADTRAALATRLDATAAALAVLPRHVADDHGAALAPWWQRLLAPLVTVRPATVDTPVARADRIAAADSLQIELSLARAALERGDAAGWSQALARASAWVQRLWPASPARSHALDELQALARAPLHPDIPELGTTLQQLRALRDARSTP